MEQQPAKNPAKTRKEYIKNRINEILSQIRLHGRESGYGESLLIELQMLREELQRLEDDERNERAEMKLAASMEPMRRAPASSPTDMLNALALSGRLPYGYVASMLANMLTGGYRDGR